MTIEEMARALAERKQRHVHIGPPSVAEPLSDMRRQTEEFDPRFEALRGVRHEWRNKSIPGIEPMLMVCYQCKASASSPEEMKRNDAHYCLRTDLASIIKAARRVPGGIYPVVNAIESEAYYSETPDPEGEAMKALYEAVFQ